MSTQIVRDKQVERAVLLVLEHQRKPVTYWQIAQEAGYFSEYAVIAALVALVNEGKVTKVDPGKRITATYELAGAPWAVSR